MNSRNMSASSFSTAKRMPNGHTKFWVSLLTVIAAPASSLFAHPGHGHETLVAPSQPAHWFIEPEHAATWMLLGVLTWMAYRVLEQTTVRTEPAMESER